MINSKEEEEEEIFLNHYLYILVNNIYANKKIKLNLFGEQVHNTQTQISL